MHNQKTPIERLNVAKHLLAVRSARRLSQRELAEQSHLKRQQINYFETGARTPSVEQLFQIARALDIPLERLLTGANRPRNGLRDVAVELRCLGLIDLWVDSAVVPAAFRPSEEVIALAIAPQEPEARIVEGIPALLAWNRWSPFLLRAFARNHGRKVLYRLAWLADVVLAIDRLGGFPGGCPGKEDLAAFVKSTKKPSSDRWDDLGRPTQDKLPKLPAARRWRINYAAELATFRQRATQLTSLAEVEGRQLSAWQT